MVDLDHKYACIYKIEHRASGKFYIGSTLNRIERWRNHKTKSTCLHLRRAVAKHGLQEFDFVEMEKPSSVGLPLPQGEGIPSSQS